MRAGGEHHRAASGDVRAPHGGEAAVKMASACVQSDEANGATIPGWLVVFILIVLASTLIPYAYFRLNTPPDRAFIGPIHNLVDHNVYFSWVEQVR